MNSRTLRNLILISAASLGLAACNEGYGYGGMSYGYGDGYYGDSYYAAFVIDPDGYRIEAVLNGDDPGLHVCKE